MWIIIKLNLERYRRMAWYGLDYVAEDRDQWRTLVNTVMNLQIP
jgi:hypothetical protein